VPLRLLRPTLLIVLSAGTIAAFLLQRPGLQKAQHWMMGGMLGFLAVRMAVG
jgi:threonine/homoserine/homoserine lactone efflux protein